MRNCNYVLCPFCKNPTALQVLPQTILLNFPLICTACGKENVINLVDGKLLVESSEKIKP